MNNHIRYYLYLAFLVCTVSACGDSPKIIFDTDFGGDADDLGALAMLHHFVDRGECDLLAVMSWNLESSAVSAIDAVNHYYGHPDIPIGTRKGDFQYVDWNYCKPIADRFPSDIDHEKAEESTVLYRKLLAVSDDHDVIIVTVGPLSNIQRLLASGPDGFSKLSGKELIEQKVREFVIMGGQFPEGEKEWNFDGDMRGVTKDVLEQLTVPITFSGYELGLIIKTGEVFNNLDHNTPLYVGFKHFSEHAPWIKANYEGKILDNSTYDQTAVLYAVRNGVGQYWEKVGGGYCQADETGGNKWVKSDQPTNHTYLKLTRPEEEIAGLIESMMLGEF